MFSALFVQRRVRSHNGSPVWEELAAAIRIPQITGFQKTETIPGGYETASFVIPLEQARYDPEDLNRDTTVWVYDGAEPCFFGHVAKPLLQLDGSILVTANGAWAKADRTQMRIVWADNDISQWVATRTNNSNGTVDVKSDGTLRLVMNAQTKHNQGEHCAVDYFLFGESAGVRDGKAIDGVHFEQNENTFGNSFEFRIYGLDSPNDPNPDLVFTSGANQPISRRLVSDGSSGDDTNGWPSQDGYRCLRVGLWCTQDVDLSNDKNDQTVGISLLRVSTRARQVKLLDEHQSSTLVKDLWDDAGRGYDVHNLLQEEAAGSTGEAVVGAIAPNHQNFASMSFPEWTSPRQMLETMAGEDGCIAGMWAPTSLYTLGALVSAGSLTRQYWYRQPPELVYKDWPDIHDPDYLIRLGSGAEWVPDGQGDDLLEATYVTYSNRTGKTKSLFAEDTSPDNYLYAQGWHEAESWQLDPPVGDSTAATLAGRYTQSHEQPTLSGTLRLNGAQLDSIIGRGGERILKLSLIHAGVVIRIVDAQGPQVGRVTGLTYTSAAGGQPEQLELAVNSPIGARLDRTITRLGDKYNRRRNQ